MGCTKREFTCHAPYAGGAGPNPFPALLPRMAARPKKDVKQYASQYHWTSKIFEKVSGR